MLRGVQNNRAKFDRTNNDSAKMPILANTTNLVRTGISWQEHMKLAIRDPRILAQHLCLPVEVISRGQAEGPFPLFAPLPYVSRIEPGNPRDPLLLQLLPTAFEDVQKPGFDADPLNESQYSLRPGLLQKYTSRVLLVTTGSCAIHCRYCFRRNFPYATTPKSLAAWENSIQQIEADPSIDEVILSGGDPLTLVDATLENLVQRLELIDHLKRVRIHTRLPIVIPQRVTSELLGMLSGKRLNSIVVLHANHANEIDDEVRQSIESLAQSGTVLLNQSVLLRGINDSVSALIRLSERLIDCGVLPYYLHQLDPVRGTAHFHVPIDQGVRLIQEMQSQVSGYLVPRYVQEVPGRSSKTVLA